MRLSLLYQDKAKRDLKFQELKASGELVKKGIVRNQQLHPMYVEDLKNGISQEDRGFGNTIYNTLFSVLYEIRFLN